MQVLFTDSFDKGEFEIKELFDEKTNEKIDTVNPGVKGQLVKINIPFDNLKPGTVIRKVKNK